jgi:uncharacterized membrane protein YoaK (UPF0700 family)
MAANILPRQVPKPMPTLLSFVAGYIDSVTFLGLYGIFVAQMTGSFVLAGTQFVASEQGYLVKLLAIPVFFLAGCLATLIAALAEQRNGHALALVMAFECLLLTALVLMHVAAPMTHIETPAVRAAALLGIAAMGVQSAMVRLLMRGVASTNVMTTNTTQMAVDATLLLLHALRPSAGGAAASVDAARERMSGLLPIMIGFVSGTAVGALGYATTGFWTLLVPLALAYGVCGWAFYAVQTGTETAS